MPSGFKRSKELPKVSPVGTLTSNRAVKVMGLDDLLSVVLKSSPELLKTGDYTTVVINLENGAIGNIHAAHLRHHFSRGPGPHRSSENLIFLTSENPSMFHHNPSCIRKEPKWKNLILKIGIETIPTIYLQTSLCQSIRKFTLLQH